MQSGDSKQDMHIDHAPHLNPMLYAASQPMWPLNDQISKISLNLSCPTGRGQLDCLRKKSGLELQQVLLATGTQFQPVTDNITIFKE